MTQTLTDLVGQHASSMHPCLAIVLSPERAVLARSRESTDGGAVLDVAGEPVDSAVLDRAFDATLFNADRQVRLWLDHGRARIAVIGCASPCSDRPDGQQLIWGTVIAEDHAAPDWVRVHDARIGMLDVPVASEVSPGGRLAFLVHECRTEDAHGNVTIASTRFRGIVQAAEGSR